jgi:glutamine synthetase adenylyltransferase
MKAKTAEREGQEFLEAYRHACDRNFDNNAQDARDLFGVFGRSNILSAKLIANPLWADEICRPPYLKKPKSAEILSKEINRACEGLAGSEIGAALRKFKYREMARIVVKNISRRADEREILLEWSDVADCILAFTYRFVFDNLTSKYGLPTTSAGDICHGAIISLGKLGAQELNMSSDIDLIFVYDSDNSQLKTSHEPAISNHEFYVKLASDVTKFLTASTEDGFLYRVDHALRPEGAQGTLANSLDAAERYYQYFGSSWERQALIRARPAAGNSDLGHRFMKSVEPFVYKRTISMGDLSHMRLMKVKIEQEGKSSQGPFNLKLGSGGIRELEFFVQALIRLYGGSHPEIRTHNTFEAIKKLCENSFISENTAASLLESYKFLRRTENFMQFNEDRQVHSLPKNDAALLDLALKLGFDNSASFTDELEGISRSVHRLFSCLFEEDYERCEMEDAIRENLDSCQNEEERIDSLAWFKKHEHKKLAEIDLEEKIAIPLLFKKLSTVADAVVGMAFEITSGSMKSLYGLPQDDLGRAKFSIVAMGSLGSREMDYGSDLDLCFLYSGDGMTNGEIKISNVEFFTKLAQKIIALISMNTRYGRAYSVDSELRPSGGQGALVTTLDSFREYHEKRSELWERLSLLKTRTIAGDPDFLQKTMETIFELAYLRSPPGETTVKSEIKRLRGRQRDERSADGTFRYDLKLGNGSIADIDSIIRYHQLMNSGQCKSLCVQNSFDLLAALENEGIISDSNYSTLLQSLTFMHDILSRLRLYKGRSAGYVDEKSRHLEELAKMCKISSAGLLVSSIIEMRKIISEIYCDTFSCQLPGNEL